MFCTWNSWSVSSYVDSIARALWYSSTILQIIYKKTNRSTMSWWFVVLCCILIIICQIKFQVHGRIRASDENGSRRQRVNIHLPPTRGRSLNCTQVENEAFPVGESCFVSCPFKEPRWVLNRATKQYAKYLAQSATRCRRTRVVVGRASNLPPYALANSIVSNK